MEDKCVVVSDTDSPELDKVLSIYEANGLERACVCQTLKFRASIAEANTT